MTKLEQIKASLEQAIDDSSLDTVLELIGTICHEKADHLRSNWQDHTTAVYWQYAAKAIEHLAATDANVARVSP